jgi:hydrogenase maturation protease
MNAQRTLVIGYGNTLRGDDGIGPWVASAIAAYQWPHVLALAVLQLVPELAETLAHSDLAIFIDAHLDVAGPPVAVAALLPRSVSARSHVGEPGSLLALAHDLYGRTPSAWLVRAAGEDFSLRESLSTVGLRNAAEARDCVAALLGPRAGGPVQKIVETTVV